MSDVRVYDNTEVLGDVQTPVDAGLPRQQRRGLRWVARSCFAATFAVLVLHFCFGIGCARS